MLLIYIPKLTPRITYSIKTLLSTFLRFSEYEFTTSLEAFLNHQGAKFSYSDKPNESGIHFHSIGLLEQKGITELEIELETFGGTVVLFYHNRKSSALPFDPFAASFFMLSRYEEYLPHIKDSFNRFSSRESLAHKNNFLHQAVVDRWALMVKSELKEAFPELNFPERKFSFIPTIDIDNAFAFKHKGMLRTLGSLSRSFFSFDFDLLGMQIKTLFGLRKDPFDTYNYQLNLQKKYKLKPIYFFLLGDYGLNDKNIFHENKHFQSLIKSIADYARVGIHPSFGSNKKPEKVQIEIRRLSRIIKREVNCSRQHFLKLSLPDTYRNLVKSDIEEDYTMGYADAPGFRAGSCTPYYFYDLDGEMEVKLKIFPFQVMESTYKYYHKLPLNQIIPEIRKLVHEVKKVRGTFISLWHNESLSEEMGWEGWRAVYEDLIESAVGEDK